MRSLSLAQGFRIAVSIRSRRSGLRADESRCRVHAHTRTRGHLDADHSMSMESREHNDIVGRRSHLFRIDFLLVNNLIK